MPKEGAGRRDVGGLTTGKEKMVQRKEAERAKGEGMAGRTSKRKEMPRCYRPQMAAFARTADEVAGAQAVERRQRALCCLR